MFLLLTDLSTKSAEIIAGIITGLGSIGYILFLIYKNFPKLLRKIVEKLFSEEKENHLNATLYRKKITPKIKEMLSELAEHTGADRALLFEYSNGSSNLVGLPFLYLTATIEVLRPGVSSVIQNYQKINMLLIAEFIENLDDKSYFYTRDLEEIKCPYPMVYNFMYPNGVKSALFYALYDDKHSIGFIVLTSVKNSFERTNALPRIATMAQQVSGLLNYNKIKKELG